MINGVVTLLSSMMSSSSSVFSRFVCAGGITGVFNKILNFIFGLLYTIAKYVLYVVDVIFSYIQKLAGLDMAMDSLENMISPDSDIIFNFLISGSDLVTAILRNLIVLAIVMIIIFAIVGIIKGQIDAMKKNSPVSPFETLKTTLKAFVLLLITPFITLGGIIVSDLILQSLYRATNITGAMSLGTQIFLSSSSAANSYRLYAQSDQRIPITLDVSQNSEINDYFNENTVSEGFVKYLAESKEKGNEYNPIYATYMSFVANDFSTFTSMNDIISSRPAVKNSKAIYETYYDFYVPSEGEFVRYPELARIESYAEQYYVMADVIDFCVRSGSTIYMRTIEQMLNSICTMNDQANAEQVFRSVVQQYGIKFYEGYDAEEDVPVNELVLNTPLEYLNFATGKGRNIIGFTSDYMALSDSGDPEIRMQLRSLHIVGETDELKGAKFIITAKREIKNASGETEFYYEPMTNTYVGSYNTEFNSDHIRDGSIVVAKGIFKDSTYPTAIKIGTGKVDSTDIVFYREDIESQAVGQMDKYLSFHVESSGGVFGKLIKLIKALFNPAELIPKLEVDFNAMVLTYEKAESPTEIDSLIDGEVRLGYFMKFNPTYPTVKFASNFCMSFTELYKAQKLNFLLLIVGSILLAKVCLSAISSLIERVYELFLIFLTYPAACATIPVDDGGAYNTWLKGYFERVFRTYGFILGINFVLMLFPVIESLEFFTQDEIGTSLIVRRVGVLFFNSMTVREITNMMNLMVGIIFELVAFTLIETIPEVVATIVGGKDSALKLRDNNIFKNMISKTGTVVKAVGKVVVPALKGVGYVAAGLTKDGKEKQKQMRKNLRNKMLNKVGLDAFSGDLFTKDANGKIQAGDMLRRWTPGSKIAEEANYKKSMKDTQQNQRAQEEEMFKTLNDPLSTEADAKRALAKYQSAAVKASGATGNKKWKHEGGCNTPYSDDQLRAEDDKRKYKLNPDGSFQRDTATRQLIRVDKSEYARMSIRDGSGWLCPKCWHGSGSKEAARLTNLEEKNKKQQQEAAKNQK